MEKDIDYNVEGGKLIVVAKAKVSVDADKDGIKSVELDSVNTLTIDGMEALSELFKDQDFLASAMEKFGFKK